MICENCQQEYNEVYGSGRFCSAKCARGFSTKNKRKEINEKVSKSLTGVRHLPDGNKVRICEYGCKGEAKFQLSNEKWCCEDSYNKCPEIRRKNSKALKKAYKENKRTYRYYYLMCWTKNKDSEGYKQWVEKVKNDVFVENPSRFGVSHKKLLIEMFNWEYKCNTCGISEWNQKPLVLALDHINGNNRDYRFENLRFLCPNCHSQTDTYCGKNNINKGKIKVTDELFIEYLKNSKNIHQTLIKCGLTPKAENYTRAYKLIEENGIKMGE